MVNAAGGTFHIYSEIFRRDYRSWSWSLEEENGGPWKPAAMVEDIG